MDRLKTEDGDLLHLEDGQHLLLETQRTLYPFWLCGGIKGRFKLEDGTLFLQENGDKVRFE
jgi:hypothetical protein